MRIISQDGTGDFPYEHVCLERFGTAIYVLSKNLIGVEEIEDYTMAVYVSEGLAKAAFNTLHEAYLDGDKIFQFSKVGGAER
jgi:hypothetical protein